MEAKLKVEKIPPSMKKARKARRRKKKLAMEAKRTKRRRRRVMTVKKKIIRERKNSITTKLVTLELPSLNSNVAQQLLWPSKSLAIATPRRKKMLNSHSDSGILLRRTSQSVPTTTLISK
jgi:hypothetical protein